VEGWTNCRSNETVVGAFGFVFALHILSSTQENLMGMGENEQTKTPTIDVGKKGNARAFTIWMDRDDREENLLNQALCPP